jgi:single-strand DNA-binding protein
MRIEAAFFGTLGKDAESKTSTAGKPYLRLNIRVGDGEGAIWVSVSAFDATAIRCADNFKKGARVYIEGALRPTEWTGQDGAQRHGLSVMAWHCRLAAIGRNRHRREKHKPSDQQQVVPARHSTDGTPFDDPLPVWTP